MEMSPSWSRAHDWKSCKRESVSRVRISPSPPAAEPHQYAPITRERIFYIHHPNIFSVTPPQPLTRTNTLPPHGSVFYFLLRCGFPRNLTNYRKKTIINTENGKRSGKYKMMNKQIRFSTAAIVLSSLSILLSAVIMITGAVNKPPAEEEGTTAPEIVSVQPKQTAAERDRAKPAVSDVTSRRGIRNALRQH